MSQRQLQKWDMMVLADRGKVTLKEALEKIGVSYRLAKLCDDEKVQTLDGEYLAKIRTSKRLRSQRHTTSEGRSLYGI